MSSLQTETHYWQQAYKENHPVTCFCAFDEDYYKIECFRELL